MKAVCFCILLIVFVVTANPVSAQAEPPASPDNSPGAPTLDSPEAEFEINTILPGKKAPAYGCYRTLDNYYETAAFLSQTYPDLVKTIEIGKSWDGNPLIVIKISNDIIEGEKPKMFLMGGVHGNEKPGAETAIRFAEYLLSNYETDSEIKSLVDSREIHILPVANPDGFLMNKRKNDSPDTKCSPSKRGVDLNRNNMINWRFKKINCDINYPGKSANSEPETLAIQAYMNSIFPDQNGLTPEERKGIYVSLHAWGGSINYPWWYTKNAPPSADLMKSIAVEMARKNKYKVGQGSRQLYKMGGSFEDYAYTTYGIPSFTIEIGKNKLLFIKCKYYEMAVSKNINALLVALRRAGG